MTKMFRLNWNDLVKGLVVAIITALLGGAYKMIQSCGFDCSLAEWISVIEVGVTAGVGYLVKNFLTNENGKFIGKIG